MADFTGYSPYQDPSRRKASAVSASPGTSNYPNQVAGFNSWLYTPMDRRPDIPSTPGIGSLGGGYTGATQPFTAGNYQTPYGNVSTYNVRGLAAGGYHPPTSNPSGSPDAYSQGTAPSGRPDGPQSSGFLGLGTSPTASVGQTDNSNIATPPQNALQRWQGSGSGNSAGSEGVRPISDARRYFWATGSIDGRAPQAQPPQGLGTNSSRGYASVKFNNSASNWSPY